MASKQVHYNMDNIESKGAIYNLIYGEKSNGKSWQVKHKRGILKYLKTGKRFVLLRRWREDITNLWIEQYFADVDVAGLTKNKYNCIVNYRKVLYLAIASEDGKVVRGDKIGYVMALSTEQHYSGGSFLDVEDIIFEEFQERGNYLRDEAAKLEILYSTIDRKRGVTRVWLVGNAISKINPYIQDWNLDKVIRKQKQGDIDVITIHNEENDVTIAIEYCMSSGGKQMSIKNQMIDKGIWQSDNQPKLKKSYNEYEVIYIIGFFFKGFKYLGEYIRDKETKEKVWFIKPYVKDFKDKTIVVSDNISQSPYWICDIYNTTFKNNKLNNLLKTFREDSIFYSDDLTGTEFKKAINFIIRR